MLNSKDDIYFKNNYEVIFFSLYDNNITQD